MKTKSKNIKIFVVSKDVDCGVAKFPVPQRAFYSKEKADKYRSRNQKNGECYICEVELA